MAPSACVASTAPSTARRSNRTRRAAPSRPERFRRRSTGNVGGTDPSDVTWSRVLARGAPFAVVVVAAVGLAVATGAAASSSAPAPAPVERTWQADCAVCHGAEGRGTDRAPSLGGVGRASVDYELTTGRMPLRGTTVERHAPAYDAATIRALVDYVGALVADPGTPVPAVGRGDVAAGGEIYRENCAACHAWSGDGGALYHRAAPALDRSTPTQVAEAVRVGPGQMPAFGAAALTPKQLDDLVAYVADVQRPDDRGGAALGHLGPVAEGAASFLALGLLLWACLWIGDRQRERTTP